MNWVWWPSHFAIHFKEFEKHLAVYRAFHGNVLDMSKARYGIKRLNQIGMHSFFMEIRQSECCLGLSQLHVVRSAIRIITQL